MVDIAIVVLSRYVACTLYPQEWGNQDTIVALVAVVVFSVVCEVNGVYRSWRAIPIREELRATLWSWVLVAPPLLIWVFASKTGSEHSRLINLGWFALTAGLLVLARVSKGATLSFLRMRGRNTRTAGIIGATSGAMRLREQLSDPAHGIELVGIFDARSSERCREFLGEGEELAGDISDAVAAAKAGELDFIYIALPLKAESRISQTVAALADTTATVQLVTDFSVFDLLHARWASVGEVPTVSVFDTPFQGVARFAKRMEDLILGSLILLMVSPLMAAIAIAVKLTSRGPVFFAQTRYGLNSKPIKVLKFRSMTTQDDGSDVKQATKGDARITKLGAFLRSTSLDELPQFINVLKGDMSIVGPRPHAVAHNESYRALIHGYMLRHKVKPGITGWAQINGLRGETDTVDKMRSRVNYDLDYIENWNLSWDLEIILKTIFRVLRDKNAY
jgi:putative colanic acid biosysnthesis UDP-glucose lipid carrier transferase